MVHQQTIKKIAKMDLLITVNFKYWITGLPAESLRMYTNYIDAHEGGNQSAPHFARNAFGIAINSKNLDSVNITHGAYDIQDGEDVSPFSDSYSCKADAVKFYTRRC